MAEHVVVGYDTSPEALAAVGWAAREAERLGVPLHVVRVWGLSGQLDVPPLTTASAYVREREQEIAEEGADVARAAAPEVQVTALLKDGPPARALVDLGQDAALVVVGRHGSGRFSGAVLGSVALGVVQHAPCPVAVVPASEHDGSGLVVVGVDGSPPSIGALDAAARHAAAAESSLRVVTCWRGPARGRSLTSWLRDHPEESPDGVARRWAEGVAAAAHHRVTVRAPGVPVESVVEEGPATRVLARHAQGADLLVVGTRGRGGLAGLVLGSTSQWLVARSRCPVLITRAASTDEA